MTFGVASRDPCERHGRWATVTRACLLLHPMPFQTFLLGARSFVSGLDVVSSRRRRRRRPGLQRRCRRSGRSEGLRSPRRRGAPKFFCHLVRGTLLRRRLRPFCSEAMLAWRPAPSPLAHGRVSKKRRRDGAEESLRCASRAGALCCGSVSAHFARKLCWHGVLRPRCCHTAPYRKKEDATALKRASGAGGAQEAALVRGVPPG